MGDTEEIVAKAVEEGFEISKKIIAVSRGPGAAAVTLGATVAGLLLAIESTTPNDIGKFIETFRMVAQDFGDGRLTITVDLKAKGKK